MITNITKSYAEIDCCNCGVVFYIPKSLDENNRTTKKVFYCPNGHGQSYTKSTEQLLRENLLAAEGTINMLRQDVEVLSRKKNKK